jgi:DNA topoisomerase IB
VTDKELYTLAERYLAVREAEIAFRISAKSGKTDIALPVKLAAALKAIADEMGERLKAGGYDHS